MSEITVDLSDICDTVYGSPDIMLKPNKRLDAGKSNGIICICNGGNPTVGKICIIYAS